MLYWRVTDFGFWNARGLNLNFVNDAGARLTQLLQEGMSRYPDRTEVKFWVRYIRWCDLGADLEDDEVFAWLEEDPAIHIPALFIFMTRRGTCCHVRARALLAAHSPPATLRDDYIVSVIESTMRASE